MQIADIEEALNTDWIVEREPPEGPISQLAYGRWLVQNAPKQKRGYRLQSKALAELGRGAEAFHCLRTGLRAWGLLATRRNRAYRWAEQASLDSDLKNFSRAAKQEEDSLSKGSRSDQLVKAGDNWLSAGELEMAERCFRQACLHPEVFLDEALCGLARSLRSQGRYQEAKTVLEAALGIDEEADEAILNSLEDLDLTIDFLRQSPVSNAGRDSMDP